MASLRSLLAQDLRKGGMKGEVWSKLSGYRHGGKNYTSAG